LGGGSLIKGEVCKRNVDTGDELLAGILDAFAPIKRREDQLSRTISDIRTAAANLMVGFSNIYFKLQTFFISV